MKQKQKILCSRCRGELLSFIDENDLVVCPCECCMSEQYSKGYKDGGWWRDYDELDIARSIKV